ncbi:hypothetical protein PSN_1232 [Pseudomonas sp. NGC7]
MFTASRAKRPPNPPRNVAGYLDPCRSWLACDARRSLAQR